MKREIAVWVANVLMAAALVGSLLLNRAASVQLEAAEAGYREANRLAADPSFGDLCDFDLERARYQLELPPGARRRANMLVIAHGATRCLDDEAASALRQKTILVELAGAGAGADRDLVRELGLEIVRLLSSAAEPARGAVRGSQKDL